MNDQREKQAYVIVHVQKNGKCVKFASRYLVRTCATTLLWSASEFERESYYCSFSPNMSQFSKHINFFMGKDYSVLQENIL